MLLRNVRKVRPPNENSWIRACVAVHDDCILQEVKYSLNKSHPSVMLTGNQLSVAPEVRDEKSRNLCLVLFFNKYAATIPWSTLTCTVLYK